MYEKNEIEIFDDWYEVIRQQYEKEKELLDRYGLPTEPEEKYISHFVENLLLTDGIDDYMESLICEKDSPSPPCTSGAAPLY